MPNLDRLRMLEKQAELHWLRARVRTLEAELPGFNHQPGPLTYAPTWKTPDGVHLSAEGALAILAALKDGMKPAEAARLFRVSEKTALTWRRRVKYD